MIDVDRYEGEAPPEEGVCIECGEVFDPWTYWHAGVGYREVKVCMICMTMAPPEERQPMEDFDGTPTGWCEADA